MSMYGGFMLQRKLRLRQKSEYKAVFDQGRNGVGKYVVVYVMRGPQKFGFIASKKVGNSVQRNRARRLMREVVRLNLSNIQEDRCFVFIARPTIKGVSYYEVEKSVRQTLAKAKLLKK